MGIPQGLPLSELDQTVSARFSAATEELGRSGVNLSDEPLALLDDMVRLNAKATIPVIEGYAIHRERLATSRCTFAK